MFNEQRQKILQILYEERTDPLQAFDREDLVEQMGVLWQDIQTDVAYLEEMGFVSSKIRQFGKRIFHLLSITAKGVDFVEKPPLVRKINVFISSAGDVNEERKIARNVIDRCNRLYSIAERYVLRLLAYEENAPAEVGNRPQDVIDAHMLKASSSDLFICIIWHRMGSPFTLQETGERFQSGTEYEFLDAYRSNQKQGKPYILLYRGMKAFPPHVDPEQFLTVQDFFKRFEGEHAEFKGLYKTYQTNKDFENKLFQDIDMILSKNLI